MIVNHVKNVTIIDDPIVVAAGGVVPSDWNAGHTITLGTDENFVTDVQLLVLDNTSGTNTGDQVIPTTLPASDVYEWAKAATKPVYTASEVDAVPLATTITGPLTDYSLTTVSNDGIHSSLTAEQSVDDVVSGAFVNVLPNGNVVLHSASGVNTKEVVLSSTGLTGITANDVGAVPNLLSVTFAPTEVSELPAGAGSTYTNPIVFNGAGGVRKLIVDSTGIAFGNCFIRLPDTIAVGDYEIVSAAREDLFYVNMQDLVSDAQSIDDIWPSGIGFEIKCRQLTSAQFSIIAGTPPILRLNNTWEGAPKDNVWLTGGKTQGVGFVDRYTLSAAEYARLGYNDAWWTGTEIPDLHNFGTQIPLNNDFYLQSNADVWQLQSATWTLVCNVASTYAPLYHNHQAGIEGLPAITEGTGTFSVAAGEAWFFVDSTKETLALHDIAASGTLTPTDDTTGYVCADRDTSTWVILYNQTLIDYLRYVPYFVVFKRSGSNNLHTQVAPLKAHGEVESNYHRTFHTNRYARESGLTTIAVDTSHNITLDEGIVWAVTTPYDILAVTVDTRQFECERDGTVTSHTTPIIRNDAYDAGAGFSALGTGEFVINWIFRGVENEDHLYTMLSDKFSTAEEARAYSNIGTIPELISSHAILVGRVIAQEGQQVQAANIESAFASSFNASTSITAHNDLTGIQGGTVGDYYHVTPQIYSNLTANSYLTTAALSNHAHGFTGTNISGTFDSNGLSLSVANGGGGADGYNPIMVAGSTANSTQNVMFSNSNGVSFGLNGSVVTASHNGYTGTTTGFLTTAMQSNAARVSQWQAGTVTQNGANNQIVFTGSNGISVHGNGSTISISLQDIHHLDGFIASGNNNGTAFSSLTSGTLGMNFAGNISASQNGNNFTVSVPNQTTPTQFAGTTTAGTGVGLTVNSNGVNASVVTNYSTGYSAKAESTHVHTIQTTTIAGSTVAITNASNGATIAMPPYITTYTAQTADTNKVGIGNVSTVSTAGSLMTGSAGTNGLTLAVPAYLTNAAGGAGDGYNPIAAGGSTANSTQSIVFGNANGISFSLNGSTVEPTHTLAYATHSHGNPTLYLTNITGTTASASNGLSISLSGNAAGGGGAVTMGGWEPFPAGNNTTFSSQGQNSLYLQKLNPDNNYSFNNFELRMSGSFVSSTNSQRVNHTINYGLYSLDTNNSYKEIATSSMQIHVSFNSSTAYGITVSQGAGSYTISSNNTVLASYLTGMKHLYMPFASTLTADGQYAFGLLISSATSVGTSPFRMAIKNETVINNITIGKVYASTILASNSTFVGDYAQGVYNTTTGGMPSAIAKSQMTNAISQARMYLQLEV